MPTYEVVEVRRTLVDMVVLHDITAESEADALAIAESRNGMGSRGIDRVTVENGVQARSFVIRQPGDIVESIDRAISSIA